MGEIYYYVEVKSTSDVGESFVLRTAPFTGKGNVVYRESGDVLDTKNQPTLITSDNPIDWHRAHATIPQRVAMPLTA